MIYLFLPAIIFFACLAVDTDSKAKEKKRVEREEVLNEIIGVRECLDKILKEIQSNKK